MYQLIKNVKTGPELAKLRASLKAGARVHLRGPRANNRKEHQDCDPEFATHATLYWGSRYDERAGGERFFALTGWKGDKPVLRSLSNSSVKVWPYWKRRAA